MIDIYKEIVELIDSGNCGVVVNVIEKEGHGPSGLQSKMLVTENDRRIGSIGGGMLEKKAEEKAKEIIKNGIGCVIKYSLTTDNKIFDSDDTGMVCGGSVTLFFEYIGVKDKVYIFGAGHIGSSLAYQLKRLNFNITIIDDRKDYLEDVKDFDSKICTDFDKALNKIKFDNNSFIVISTYSHDKDLIALEGILKLGLEPRYIGMVASASKRDYIINKIKENLKSEIMTGNLYSPCGLDIGGATPNEIAISIVSEIQAIKYKKLNNKHLRDK